MNLINPSTHPSMNATNTVDLLFANLGNGLTVCDRNREEHRDYLKVAHISANGSISYYDNKLQNDAIEAIEAAAAELKLQWRKNNIHFTVTLSSSAEGAPKISYPHCPTLAHAAWAVNHYIMTNKITAEQFTGGKVMHPELGHIATIDGIGKIAMPSGEVFPSGITKIYASDF